MRRAPVVISFDQVSKRFKMHQESGNTIQERFTDLFRKRSRRHQPAADSFWALRDVSFAIRRGESVGLIGHNGSGKSTTLKLVARILEPTAGKVVVDGRISALLELGSGFHPDLTGRENIYLNGSLLGQSQAMMRRKLDEIIAFAELEDFIDTPVKHYSSGMYMRLGFAVAISVDPDILITDEVLAVGDEAFQRKCLDQIYRFKQRGKTILFVSHATAAVQALCDRVLWFEHGVLMRDSKTLEAIDAYLRATNERDRERVERERHDDADETVPMPEEDDPQRWGTREIEIVAVELLDRDGQPCDMFATGDTLRFRMHYVAHKRIEQPVFGVAIHHRNGLHINGPNTRFADYPIDMVDGPGVLEYEVANLPLIEGYYLLSAAVYDYTMTRAYDHHDRKYPCRVQATSIRERYGLFYIPSTWHWRPGRPEPPALGPQGERGDGANPSLAEPGSDEADLLDMLLRTTERKSACPSR